MKKILIADDQASIRELLMETLRGISRCRIIECDSGTDAVEKAKSEKPDLVIMDIMMPGGIDGFEAARRIKSDPDTKKCFVLFLTARGQQADREKGRGCGDDYFIKPFSPLSLIKKVEEILSV